MKCVSEFKSLFPGYSTTVKYHHVLNRNITGSKIYVVVGTGSQGALVTAWEESQHVGAPEPFVPAPETPPVPPPPPGTEEVIPTTQMTFNFNPRCGFVPKDIGWGQTIVIDPGSAYNLGKVYGDGIAAKKSLIWLTPFMFWPWFYARPQMTFVAKRNMNNSPTLFLIEKVGRKYVPSINFHRFHDLAAKEPYEVMWKLEMYFGR